MCTWSPATDNLHAPRREHDTESRETPGLCGDVSILGRALFSAGSFPDLREALGNKVNNAKRISTSSCDRYSQRPAFLDSCKHPHSENLSCKEAHTKGKDQGETMVPHSAQALHAHWGDMVTPCFYCQTAQLTNNVAPPNSDIVIQSCSTGRVLGLWFVTLNPTL